MRLSFLDTLSNGPSPDQSQHCCKQAQPYQGKNEIFDWFNQFCRDNQSGVEAYQTKLRRYEAIIDKLVAVMRSFAVRGQPGEQCR
jgi:hypothetical protein